MEDSLRGPPSRLLPRRELAAGLPHAAKNLLDWVLGLPPIDGSPAQFAGGERGGERPWGRGSLQKPLRREGRRNWPPCSVVPSASMTIAWIAKWTERIRSERRPVEFAKRVSAQRLTLSDPIDVYSDWIDECEQANNMTE